MAWTCNTWWLLKSLEILQRLSLSVLWKINTLCCTWFLLADIRWWLIGLHKKGHELPVYIAQHSVLKRNNKKSLMGMKTVIDFLLRIFMECIMLSWNCKPTVTGCWATLHCFIWEGHELANCCNVPLNKAHRDTGAAIINDHHHTSVVTFPTTDVEITSFAISHQLF